MMEKRAGVSRSGTRRGSTITGGGGSLFCAACSVLFFTELKPLEVDNISLAGHMHHHQVEFFAVMCPSTVCQHQSTPSRNGSLSPTSSVFACTCLSPLSSVLSPLSFSLRLNTPSPLHLLTTPEHITVRAGSSHTDTKSSRTLKHTQAGEKIARKTR